MFRSVFQATKLVSLALRKTPKFLKQFEIASYPRSLQGTFSMYHFSTSEANPTQLEELITEADRCLYTSNFQEAESKYRTILDLISKQEDANYYLKIATLNSLGYVLTVQGQPDKAISFLEEARKILTNGEFEDQAALRDIYYLLGKNYVQVGKLDDASKFTDEAIKVHKELSTPDDRRLCTMYYDLGIIYSRKRDWEKARSNLLDATKLYEKGATVFSLSTVYSQLGYLSRETKDFPEAVKYLEEAVNLQKEEENVDQMSKARVYFHLAQAYEITKNADSAYQNYVKFTEVTKEDPPTRQGKEEVIGLLESVGRRFLGMRKYKEALDPLLKSLDLYKQIGVENNHMIAHDQLAIGAVYLGLKEGKKAIPYLKSSVDFKLNSQKAELGSIAYIYCLLGEAHLQSSELKESLESFSIALEKYEEHLGPEDPKCLEIRNIISDLIQHLPSGN